MEQSSVKKPRAAWAVGANLGSALRIKSVYLRTMTEAQYDVMIEDLRKEYIEAQRIADDYYP